MAKIFNLVCDGNSITAGNGVTQSLAYPAMARTALITSQATLHPNAYWSVKSVAISGHTTPQRTAAFVTDVQPLFNTTYGRNIVVFFEVVNDIVTNAVTVDAAIANVTTYVTQARSYGWEIMLCTVPPTTTVTNQANTKIPQVNTILRASTALSDFPIVDLAADPSLDDPTDLTFYQGDGLHPTAAGYAVIGGLVEDTVSALGDSSPDLTLLLKRIIYDFDLLEVSNNSLWQTSVAAITTPLYRRLFEGENFDRDRFRYLVLGWDRQQQAVVYAELVAAYPY